MVSRHGYNIRFNLINIRCNTEKKRDGRNGKYWKASHIIKQCNLFNTYVIFPWHKKLDNINDRAMDNIENVFRNIVWKMAILSRPHCIKINSIIHNPASVLNHSWCLVTNEGEVDPWFGKLPPSTMAAVAERKLGSVTTYRIFVLDHFELSANYLDVLA